MLVCEESKIALENVLIDNSDEEAGFANQLSSQSFGKLSINSFSFEFADLVAEEVSKMKKKGKTNLESQVEKMQEIRDI